MGKIFWIKNSDDELFRSEMYGDENVSLLYRDENPSFTNKFLEARIYNSRRGAERSIIRNNLKNCQVIEARKVVKLLPNMEAPNARIDRLEQHRKK
ncbi:MAG: hypothetical protein COB24_11815 [Hyphomicrobiales bacterium]|nr:MAG: hypothetical protein COB24_11815 [Hyphomicrobiales bacterium]